MHPIFVLTATSAIAMLVMDFVWLSTTVNHLYRPYIGHLMAETANLKAAAVFYIIYVCALTVFVTHPGYVQQFSLTRVALLGAFFGFAAYGTFDLTNHAIMKDWPVAITIIDMLWGALLTSVVCCLSVYVTRCYAP